MRTLSFVLFSVISIVSVHSETIAKDLVINSLERNIDATSQLVRISNKITLANGGSGAIKEFLFSADPQFKDRISYIGATVTIDKMLV